MLKRNLKFAATGILIFLICVLIYVLSMDFRWSDARHLKHLRNAGQTGEVYYIPTTDRDIRYVRNGDLDKQPLVFIHGAPGSSRDFKRYLADAGLASRYNMIAVDRPGYGNSGFGRVVVSIKEQGRMIAAGLPDSSIVVGHSYGGPVASSIAMDHPEKVKRLVLLAPAVDPENEKQFLMNRFLRTKFIRFFISRAMEVALDEKLSHEASLQEMSEDWNLITCPVTVVHGKKDNIVPFANMAFLERVLSAENLELYPIEDMNHIMIWSDFDWTKTLLLLLDQSSISLDSLR